MIVLELLMIITQLVFLPLRWIVMLLYGKGDFFLQEYYTAAEYKKLLKLDYANKKVDPSLALTHKEWREKAKGERERYLRNGYVVVQIYVNVEDLTIWLAAKGLSNKEFYREMYIQELFKQKPLPEIQLKGRKMFPDVDGVHVTRATK